MLVISIFMVEVGLNEKTEAMKNADDPSILRNHSERWVRREKKTFKGPASLHCSS